MECDVCNIFGWIKVDCHGGSNQSICPCEEDLLHPLAKEPTNLVFGIKDPALVVVMGKHMHKEPPDWLGELDGKRDMLVRQMVVQEGTQAVDEFLVQCSPLNMHSKIIHLQWSIVPLDFDPCFCLWARDPPALFCQTPTRMVTIKIEKQEEENSTVAMVGQKKTFSSPVD
jgi:hypothetical protein